MLDKFRHRCYNNIEKKRGAYLMRNTGVRKTIDDLGRIVLPKEIRKSLGLGIRSAVDLYVDGEKLIITKTKNECIFCNSRDNLVEYKGKSVCEKCIEELK